MRGAKAPLVVNGWTLFAHPLFIDQIESLAAKVERLASKDPAGYKKKNDTKRLAAIYSLIFETIPQNPADARYRQGDTLGRDNKHWFRAKFYQQHRLFFRYDQATKVIIYAWVNDDQTLRAYGSGDDAYKVFKGMLDDGNPPQVTGMIFYWKFRLNLASLSSTGPQ